MFWILVLSSLLIVTLLIIWRIERMTRIRRTVGTANEANEQQVAAGIVNSLPLMDYTYTYWDGLKRTSCDECPNATVCPHCPQFAESFTGPAVDLGFDSARERMGAASMTKKRDSSRITSDQAAARAHEVENCAPTLPAIEFLYYNVMGLERDGPTEDDLVYTGPNHYLYKEPAKLNPAI